MKLAIMTRSAVAATIIACATLSSCDDGNDAYILYPGGGGPGMVRDTPNFEITGSDIRDGEIHITSSMNSAELTIRCLWDCRLDVKLDGPGRFVTGTIEGLEGMYPVAEKGRDYEVRLDVNRMGVSSGTYYGTLIIRSMDDDNIGTTEEVRLVVDVSQENVESYYPVISSLNYRDGVLKFDTGQTRLEYQVKFNCEDYYQVYLETGMTHDQIWMERGYINAQPGQTIYKEINIDPDNLRQGKHTAKLHIESTVNELVVPVEFVITPEQAEARNPVFEGPAIIGGALRLTIPADAQSTVGEFDIRINVDDNYDIRIAPIGSSAPTCSPSYGYWMKGDTKRITTTVWRRDLEPGVYNTEIRVTATYDKDIHATLPVTITIE